MTTSSAAIVAGSGDEVGALATVPGWEGARLRRIVRKRRHSVGLEQHPDDLPKRGLYTEPVRLARVSAMPAEDRPDGDRRAVFLVEVRDAEDRRCADVAVEAVVRGPERTSTVSGVTDLLGRVRFRMQGPSGRYAIRVTDVAAGGLDWDRDALDPACEVVVD
jgi:hypothetical protein